MCTHTHVRTPVQRTPIQGGLHKYCASPYHTPPYLSHDTNSASTCTTTECDRHREREGETHTRERESAIQITNERWHAPPSGPAPLPRARGSQPSTEMARCSGVRELQASWRAAGKEKG
eukprot:4831308-Pyramimonas_sp.AAC.1